MASGVKLLVAAFSAWTLLAHPTILAAPKGAAESTIHLPSGLSQGSVLGILLLLVSQEDEALRPALQALYESGFVSTELATGRDVERYVAEYFAARYKGAVSRPVFAALMSYQRMVTKELRRPGRTLPAGLQLATVRVAAELRGPALVQFEEKAKDWLGFVRTTLQLTKDAELDMIQLQTLVSQRQMALQMTTNLIAALGDAMKQIAANMGSSSPPQSQSSPSDGSSTGGAGGSAPSCPGCGCSCP